MRTGNRRKASGWLRSGVMIAAAAALLSPGTARGEIVDRVVAIVSARSLGDARAAGRIITWSGVYEAECHEAFQKGLPPPQWSPAETSPSPEFRNVLSRLVDQVLLRQLLSRSPFALSGDDSWTARLDAIRKRFPDADAFHRELARYHLTEASLTTQLTNEALVAAFVDASLRPDIRVTPEQVEAYYQTVLLPRLREKNGDAAPVPALEDVRARIQEILTQQEMDRLLDDWLARLRGDAAIELRVN